MTHSDESLVIEFLAKYPGTFVAVAEVCKRAAGRNRFVAEPEWARPAILRLETEDVLESDPYGHVRLKPGAAALKKYKIQRNRRHQETVKTYVLKMTAADDEKPFPQMLREIVTQSFHKHDPDSESKA